MSASSEGEVPPGSELPWPASALKDAGIDVIEYLDPGSDETLVRFSGGRSEGWRAFAAAVQAGLSVGELRRVWHVSEGDPVGPWWELTLRFAAVHQVETNDNRGAEGESASAGPGEQDGRVRI